ncbi:MAG: DUF1579 domain-containing protein [Aureliella sp.]
MRVQLYLATLVLAYTCGGSLLAQEAMPEMPKPSKEHGVLKKEVGDWDVEMKAWMGPGDPIVSKGTEHNEMIGGFWCISKYEGAFAGQPFVGSATMGYDSSKGVYTGSWVDSISPAPMHMTGKFDDSTKTMTWRTEGMGPDGQPVVGKMVVTYTDDDHRTMTMFNPAGPGGEMMKVMEAKYSRKVEKRKTKMPSSIGISQGSDS